MGGQASARSPLAQGLPEQYIPDQSIIENSKPLGQGLPVGICTTPQCPPCVRTDPTHRQTARYSGTRWPRIWLGKFSHGYGAGGGRDLITGGKEEGVKVSSCHLGPCTSCHLGIPSVLAPGKELFEILQMQFFFLWSTFFTQGCWTTDQL